jgi:hypothetical protein
MDVTVARSADVAGARLIHGCFLEREKEGAATTCRTSVNRLSAIARRAGVFEK